MSAAREDLPRTIGFWGAVAVMVGIIIGGGIFTAPIEIARVMGDPWLILALWLAGGVLCLFGGLTYAELATMHPESGGVYVFLREGFGRAVAFTFGWTYLLLTKPAGAAGVCMLFAYNLRSLLGVEWSPVWITIGTLVAVTLVNVLGVRLGAGVAVVLTGLKFAAVAAIVALGLTMAKGAPGGFEATPAPTPLLAALPVVLAAILWTYDGWSDVGAIAGEVKNPERMLPRVYVLGVAAVIVLYLAANTVYLRLVPLTEMRGIDGTISRTIMDRILGGASSIGGTIVTGMVVLSTLGSTHGSVITGARVTFAQARDGLMFRFLGRVSGRFRTPDAALWVQCVLSSGVAFWLQTFERLAGAFVFTMWIFYGLAGAAIFVLRARRPGAERPYRCWGYPFVPATFVAAAAAMTVLSVVQSVHEGAGARTLVLLGVLGLGFPAYAAWRRFAGQRPSP